jgi:hypothetical protein
MQKRYASSSWLSDAYLFCMGILSSLPLFIPHKTSSSFRETERKNADFNISRLDNLLAA